MAKERYEPLGGHETESAGKRKRKVSYYYDSDVSNFYYGPQHPMKPYRLRLTHDLVMAYGMFREMKVLKSHTASEGELIGFHDKKYIEFLQKITPDNTKEYRQQVDRFSCGGGSDCPAFDGLYKFCQRTTGATIDAAVRLNHGLSDIAVNWSGGFHHAKKGEASGFCYINDIVIGILELLKYYQRVLYIDTDIHHGDGVEEAFYTTDRVMTVSFHKHGDGFFPGSGDWDEYGYGPGKYYSVNFPMDSGMTDEAYHFVYKPVIRKVMEVYRPEVVVFCSGADSVVTDPIGCFNLTLKGHAECIEFVKSFNVPIMLLGGGGYDMRVTSRCWSYETSVCVGKPLSNDIPYNGNNQDSYYQFGPQFQLHLDADPDIRNLNTQRSLEKTKNLLLQNLNRLQAPPSVQFSERLRDGKDVNDMTREPRDSQNPDKSGKQIGDPMDSREFFDHDDTAKPPQNPNAQ